MKKSVAYSVFPFASSLAKALEMLGTGFQWWVATGANKRDQQKLLDILAKISVSDCDCLDMKTIGSRSVDEINKFLSNNGFDIKLGELDPGGVAVASILKVLMTWDYQGIDCNITAKNGMTYKGAKITNGIQLFVAHTYDEIICIQSAEGFNLYLTKMPFVIEDENVQAMFSFANLLSQQKYRKGDVKSVSFPEVEMDCQPDVSWLCGLSAGRDFISQALMQTKFQLDKNGAKAEAALAVAVSRGISFNQVNVVFDEPFLAWIEKPGIEIPLFVAWCDYNSWKK